MSTANIFTKRDEMITNSNEEDIFMAQRHQYPGERKPRDTSYSETWKVTEQYGLQKIEEVWRENGMYKTAEQLDTSPEVIRHIAKKNNWKRPAEKASAILQGVKNGNLDPHNFTTLDFSNYNLNKNENEDE